MNKEVKNLKELLKIPMFNRCCEGSYRCGLDFSLNSMFVDCLLEIALNYPISKDLEAFINGGHYCFLKEGNHYEICCNNYDIRIYFKSKVNLDHQIIHLILLEFLQFIKIELGVKLTGSVANSVWYLYQHDYLKIINSEE